MKHGLGEQIEVSLLQLFPVKSSKCNEFLQPFFALRATPGAAYFKRTMIKVMTILYIICAFILGIAFGYGVSLFMQKTPLPFSAEVVLVVTVPSDHADSVREAMGRAGAGRVGNYEYCSFSFKGTGRFLPRAGAHPAIGKVGSLESVEEEIIQAPCSAELVEQVITAIRHAHPYEEPGIDIMPLYYFDHSHIKKFKS